MLQYLVGVEGIAPDIITATSAGAIAATVLAQARTLDEFAQRVDEIEGDVLAMTSPERVFGKQEWLDALDGTRLGREIQQEITEGTRPPFPLGSAMTLPGNGLVPAALTARPGATPAGPAAAASVTFFACWPAPGCACPGCAAACARAAAPSSTSIRWPPRCTTGPTASPRSTRPSSAGPACNCAWP